jgi:hypothetical protein
MLSECLFFSSMRLGVPFISLRQLGAVEDNLGRLILPSVVRCTGQSGAPPDSHCSCPVRDCLPKQAQSTVVALGPLAHRRLSSAHRTVRCPLPTVGAGHASPEDCAAVGSPDSPVCQAELELAAQSQVFFHFFSPCF